jgi:nitroimidazol reductase NimA-like FMN-containing flavoprotein (pyridoxamine 5'-phosphate oxidase superfamily)
VSPVYYTVAGFTAFYWVSSPDALHSRNIAVRPSVSIAIYDSHAAVGRAEAVYLTAQAAEVPDDEIEAAAAIYNGRLPSAKHFTPDSLREPSLFRLYRAVATSHSVLIRGGDPTYGRGADSRMTVSLDEG